MGKDRNQELEAHFYEQVRSLGYRWMDFDARWQQAEIKGGYMIKRIAFQRRGTQWRVIVVADVAGVSHVQFADVENLGQSGGKLLSMLQQPVWKADKYATPAPHAVAAEVASSLTKGEIGGKLV